MQSNNGLEDIFGIIMEYIDMFSIPNVNNRPDFQKMLFNKYQFDISIEVEKETEKYFKVFMKSFNNFAVEGIGGTIEDGKFYVCINIDLKVLRSIRKLVANNLSNRIKKFNPSFITEDPIDYSGMYYIPIKINVCTEEEYENFCTKN